MFSLLSLIFYPFVSKDIVVMSSFYAILEMTFVKSPFCWIRFEVLAEEEIVEL